MTDPNQRPALLDQALTLLIAGQWRPAVDGGLLDVIDLSTGKLLARAAAGGAADIDAAVQAARNAFERGPWPAMKDALDALAALGNDSDYGLSASIWTRDLARAHRLARRLRAGNVRVNAAAAPDFAMPFGGFKQSGWGRENGREGVEAYTELKSVAINLD